MRTWILSLIGLTLVGCASRPAVELPDWTIAEREPSEIAMPLELPQLCAIPWPEDSLPCWSALDQYDIASGTNVEIAVANIDALRQTEQAYDRLVEAGKLQNELAQIRQDLLDEERRQRELDKWWYRSIIVLGLIGIGVAAQ